MGRWLWRQWIVDSQKQKQTKKKNETNKSTRRVVTDKKKAPSLMGPIFRLLQQTTLGKNAGNYSGFGCVGLGVNNQAKGEYVINAFATGYLRHNRLMEWN